MIIQLDKFGTTLTSRQLGKEAYAAFLPTLKEVGGNERVIVDFSGVNTFSPSWGDEFLTSLMNKFGNRVRLKKTTNPSVRVTIEMLEEINKYKFIFID